MATPDRLAASVTSRTNPSNSSTPANPYCAHSSDGNRLAVRPDEDEFHLVPDQRGRSGRRQTVLDALQNSSAAVRIAVNHPG